jgi:hypothetical protein
MEHKTIAQLEEEHRENMKRVETLRAEIQRQRAVVQAQIQDMKELIG